MAESASALAERYLEERRALGRLLAARRLEPLLATELTIQQLRIVLLVSTGEVTTGAGLARALDISAPSVSTAVERLVELGYLDRVEGSGDRRVKHLSPTVAARRLQEELLELRDASSETLAQLAPEDLEALLRGTRALRRVLEARSPSPVP